MYDLLSIVYKSLCFSDGTYLAVLLTFVQGREVSQLVPFSGTLLQSIGSYIGMLRKDLKVG